MVDLLLPRQTPLPSRQRLEEKVVADHVNFTLTLCAPSTEMRIGLLCANNPICNVDPSGLVAVGTVLIGIGQVSLAAAIIVGIAGAEVGSGGTLTPVIVGIILVGAPGAVYLGGTGLANIPAGIMNKPPITGMPQSNLGIITDAVVTKTMGPEKGETATQVADVVTDAAAVHISTNVDPDATTAGWLGDIFNLLRDLPGILKKPNAGKAEKGSTSCMDSPSHS